MIYSPEEDSFLLAKYVEKYAKGKVLDVGTGTGILAEAALRKTKNVLAVDINKEAVEFASKKGIKAKVSDLFSNVKGKFDLIVFNPPYLPEDKIKDKELVGGKKGYEVLDRFFSKAKKYLNKDGRILIIISSLTKPKKVEEVIKKNKFKFKILEKKHYFFEDLIVYLIE